VRSCSEMCGGECGEQPDVLVITGDARHIALFEKSRKRLMLVPMDDEQVYYTPDKLAVVLRALVDEAHPCPILLVADADSAPILKSVIPKDLMPYVETSICSDRGVYTEDEALLCFIKRVERLFWPTPEVTVETCLKEYR
jgi:hypothetical protein